MTNDTFSKLPFAFPESTVASWKFTKARAEFLATFRPVAYDCCISSCCCFVGPNGDLTQCPYCHEPRFNSKGRSRRRFTYAPLVPHGSGSSTKTKSLDVLCSIEVNTNPTAPISRMSWTAQTISFVEPMLPSMVSLALTNTLKIIGTSPSASQPMDFAHFGSTKTCWPILI